MRFLIFGLLTFCSCGYSHFKDGEQKLKASYIRASLESFNKAIQLDPKNARAYNYRGYAKYLLNDFNGANSDLNKAIELDSSLAEAYSNLGLVSLYSDNEYSFSEYDKSHAEKMFNKAIELNPMLAAAYYNRGSLKEELGDYKGAIEDYGKGIKLDPKHPDSSKILWAKMTYNLIKVAQTQELEKQTKLIEMNPSNAQAYYDRAICQEQLGDHLMAADDFKRYIKIAPNSTQGYFNKGRAKYELGDYQGAVNDATEVIKIAPNYAMAYQLRAEAKLKLNDIAGYLDDAQKALVLDIQDGKYLKKNK